MNYLCCAIACIISCVRWFNPRCTKVWGHNTHQNNERWIALVENGQQTSETAKLTISSLLRQHKTIQAAYQYDYLFHIKTKPASAQIIIKIGAKILCQNHKETFKILYAFPPI